MATKKIKTNGEILFKAISDDVLSDESKITLRLNALDSNTDKAQSVITTAALCGIGVGMAELDDYEDIVIFSNIPIYDIYPSVVKQDVFRMTYNNSKGITIGEMKNLFKNGILRKNQEYYLMIVSGRDDDQYAINNAFSVINNYMLAVISDDSPNSLLLESRETLDDEKGE